MGPGKPGTWTPTPPAQAKNGRNKEGAAHRVQPTGCNSPACAESPPGRLACGNLSDHCRPHHLHLHVIHTKTHKGFRNSKKNIADGVANKIGRFE